MREAGEGGAIFARMYLFMNERIEEGRNDIAFSGIGVIALFVDTH